VKILYEENNFLNFDVISKEKVSQRYSTNVLHLMNKEVAQKDHAE